MKYFSQEVHDQLIEKIIHRCSGKRACRPQIVRAGGGCIAQSYIVTCGQQSWFVKMDHAAALPMFEAEAEGLVALGSCDLLRVPEVLGCGQEAHVAFLLLEHIRMHPLQGSAPAFAAGRALAALHRIGGEAFGWHHDNFIGNSLQHNALHENWPCFFTRYRLRPQLEMAMWRGAPERLIDNGHRLAEQAEGFFATYRPSISLTHGDLWGGNAALDEAGHLVLFDPAVHYADRETDLAMSELFGGFPAEFYAGYEASWPLDEGYPVRRGLYQLYHVLNHFNLFGGAYLSQADRLCRELLASL